jgi:hypothetical protein
MLLPGTPVSFSTTSLMSSSLSAAVERARERFRRDVADQLQLAAAKAGITASVTLDGELAVIELGAAGPDGAPLQVIAAFDEDAEPGASDRVSVRVERGEERNTLLTLAWRDDPSLDEGATLERRLAELEGRTDERLPLERRGLNASAADVRTGRYAKGDVIRQLAGDLKRAAPHTLPAPEPSHALVLVERPRPPSGRPPDGAKKIEDRGGHAPEAPSPGNIETQRANVSELLISSLMQAMERELAESESHFVGPGVSAGVRGRLGRAMEWAMLGTAYGVEAKTNQIAVASFLGSGAASWLYGLVGPVLIGGLAALSNSKLGKGAAYGLLMSWALAMASITASDKGYLDRAQGYFPKQTVVLAHEQAVGAARVRKEAAEAELKRLSAPLRGASELLADARKRWQAAEIGRAAKREAELREKARAQAQKTAVEAGVALNEEELRLREALLNDPSRAWAWRILFAIFAVINLAGPLAIARVLERWRADHIEARASARDGHKKKAAVALLRGSRSAQQAHAMLLLPALVDDLKRGGVAPELIAGLDLVEIGRKAAERFDRGVNAKRTARSWLGLRGPPEGPG